MIVGATLPLRYSPLGYNPVRQKYKIMTMAQTQFSANDQIVFTLPEGLVDLTTLTLHGKLTTTATGGTTPSTYAPPIEAMIDSIYIDVKCATCV